MKHDIVPSWKWRDPGEIIERLVAESAAIVARAAAPVVKAPRVQRDRHYTQARRLHLRDIMKRVLS